METTESQEITPSPPSNKILNSIKAALNAMLVPVLAVFTALVIGGVIIAWAGGNPFAAYKGLF